MEFLANFECETRLGVCEHSKFAKSPQNAPKDEFLANRNAPFIYFLLPLTPLGSLAHL